MALKSASQIRAAREFRLLLNMTKAKALMNGKKIPSDRKLTYLIAKKLKSEGIDIYDSIKF